MLWYGRAQRVKKEHSFGQNFLRLTVEGGSYFSASPGTHGQLFLGTPAEMWTARTQNTAAAFGTVTRSTRRHDTLKSQYDALVIGGGGFCAEVTISA